MSNNPNTEPLAYELTRVTVREEAGFVKASISIADEASTILAFTALAILRASTESQREVTLRGCAAATPVRAAGN